MNLIIKSKQIFESHTDMVEEKHNCNIVFFDKGFKVEYDNYQIKYKNNIFYILTPEMKLRIQIGKEFCSTLNTPYGYISIAVKGMEFSWNKDPFNCYLIYSIKLGNTESYINEMQMFVEN